MRTTLAVGASAGAAASVDATSGVAAVPAQAASMTNAINHTAKRFISSFLVMYIHIGYIVTDFTNLSYLFFKDKKCVLITKMPMSLKISSH
jgi:hypothetical protein